MTRLILVAILIAIVGVFLNWNFIFQFLQHYIPSVFKSTPTQMTESRDQLLKMATSVRDPSSFCRPDEWKTSKIHWNVKVDFNNRILDGFVELTVEKQEDCEAEKLILDTRDLKIKSVTHVESGAKLQYVLHTSVGSFGSKLEIQMPLSSNTATVRVKYETSPKSSALQWLTPEQTTGKRHPYMFSQCQAIHARSMLPCQDSPGIKAPFTATVTAPKELTVLMGALNSNKTGTAKGVHHFTQPMPVPSYLIAIAVGDLERREISSRCAVWSEREIVEKAAYEFSETEVMLQTGESLLGPYVWGRYDLLVLPPSFPFGGMENPCLTFVTPTLLAGDRSLATVVAHEIAHSWTGNLVTNSNFEHFWLNEGFTVFIERKIIGRMHGESCRHFEAIIGWKELTDSIDNLGESNPLTNLVVNLTGVDPDDAFSTVPYEKGHSFLFYLEEKMGGAKVFEEFLKSYIQLYQNKSLDTDEWKKYFLAYFEPKVSREILDGIDWNSWLYKPGMPPVELKFDTSLADECTKLRKLWTTEKNLELFSKADIANMTSKQVCEFLSQLLQEKEPLPVEKMEALTRIYSLNECENSEIKFRWLRLGIRSQWNGIIQPALDFVIKQGRMKFVRPIYRDLYSWEVTRQQAIDTYRRTEQQMMYVTAAMVAKDLHLQHLKN